MNEQNNIIIRRAVPADAVPLRELAVRTYYETFAPSNTLANMQAYISTAFSLPQFEMELEVPMAAFYLAHVERVLTGYAKLMAGEVPACVTGPAALELVRLYVDRPWHGAGVAHALMETCLCHARSEGFKTIYLGVWERNFRAQAFYRKWGFERIGEHIFQMGDDPQTDWWMARGVE